MVQVGQFVASKPPQNNEVSLGDGWRLTQLRPMRVSCSASPEFRLWRIGVGFLRRSNQIAFEREEGEQAKGGVVCLLGGNSPRITSSVGSMGQNYRTEARIGDWP
jgi:hypothetical protein